MSRYVNCMRLSSSSVLWCSIVSSFLSFVFSSGLLLLLASSGLLLALASSGLLLASFGLLSSVLVIMALPIPVCVSLAVTVSCLSNTTLSLINFNVFIRFPANIGDDYDDDDDYGDDDDDDDDDDDSVIDKTKTTIPS